MNTAFQRIMADAARLTRSGDLQRATQAIQAALGQAAIVEPPPHPVAPALRLPAPPQPNARPEGQFIAGVHHEGGAQRAYKLYVPPGLDGRPAPLVVMLHGCKQDPDDFAAGTAMNEAARERGFLVLYPAQSQQANASRCWNWFKHSHQQRDRGEPRLIAGMTRDVMKRHDVDPRRVYVAGLSAGGAMAAIVGAAYPDLYAAVGVHSGLAAGAASDLQGALQAMKSGAAAAGPARRSPPTIVFHGDRDTIVHPVNGEHAAAAGARQADAVVESAVSAGGRRYSTTTYREPAGRVVAEHWVIHGAGHAWAGGSARGSYTDPKGPDATAEMLRFFFANPLQPD
jgi:poly(hydroxyalkanoate) depolymerase family esterase